MKRIAIIGGGISGLSAAFYLEKARKEGAELEYALFESGQRLGGCLSSDRIEGCLVEAGPDSFLLELAQAQLVRELFPGAPLKYMPPTTRVTEDVLAGCLLDAFFNLAGLMTDQSILCVGLMPEGIDLPFRADRDLALANIRYVRAAAGRLGLSFAPDSFVVDRAHQVLDGAVSLLRRISTEGLLNAIADGTFGAARRPPAGGHGLDGVVTRADGYFNPVTEILDGTDEGAPPMAPARVPV